ncbi:MAG TPA: hypothetical protein VFT42_07380 [Solirubrobacteraceae bacterium]|nr:hypothetical protein [Solirubrobacteraceae bacterium]
MKQVVRVWLPVAIVVLGIVLIAIRPNEDGLEGGTMVIAAGLSVWLLNVLYRLGVSGDRDRDVEDRARAFFDEHGHWPDEEPPAAPPPGPRTDPHPRRAAAPPRRRG